MEEQELNELYEKVLKACKEANNFTCSFMQRHFGIDYEHASLLQQTFIQDGLMEIPPFQSGHLKNGKNDPFYQQVLSACKEANDFSTLFIQKKFLIGYAFASEICDIFIEEGISE